MPAQRIGLKTTASGWALALMLLAACGAPAPAQAEADTETGDSAVAEVDAGELQPARAAPPVAALAPQLIPEDYPPAGEAQSLTPPQAAPPSPLAAPPPALEGKAIVVDQALQVMAVFEDGVEIRRLPVSTGRPTYTTYTLPWSGYVGRYVGTFQSYTGGKADYAWYLYEATGAILMHSAPYREENGVKRYYGLEALGRYPSSAGCIRLHPDDARWLTEWNPLNVPVTITQWPGPIEGLLSG